MADINVTIGATLENLQAAVDGAKESINSLSEGFSGLTQALGAGAIGLFIEKMAELGEVTERSASILGISAEATQELGLIARASGSSLESITTQLTRLQIGMERGEKSTSIQAAAFKALGISVKDFINTPVDKQMNLFADAVKRLSDEGKNAAPALGLISRGLAQMMPELEGGSAHLDEFKQRSIEAGAVVSGETSRALDTLNGELVILKGSLQALGEVLVAAVSPSIIQFAHEVEQATVKLVAQIATGTLLTNLLKELELRLERVKAFWLGNAAAVAEVDKQLKELNDTIDVTIQKYTAMIATAANAIGKTPVKVNIPGADSAAVKAADETFKALKEKYEFDAKTFQITEQQKTAYLIAALGQRRDAEIKAGEDSLVAQKKYEADYIKAINEMNEQAFKSFKSLADSIATDFSSAFDQVLTKQKTFGQAMGEMFGKMIEKFIADLIKLIAEYAILRAVAGTALAPGIGAPSFGALAAGVFPTLGGVLGGAGQAAQTTATTANTAAVTALTGVITAHSAVTAADTAATTTHTAVVAPNTVATVANTFATELNTIKGFFPGFQSGSSYVPQTGLALVHEGEAIIPASQNPLAGVQSGGGTRVGSIGGNGGNVSLSISAMDASSFASWLRSGGGNMLSRYISNAWQQNPSLRPGYSQ